MVWDIVFRDGCKVWMKGPCVCGFFPFFFLGSMFGYHATANFCFPMYLQKKNVTALIGARKEIIKIKGECRPSSLQLRCLKFSCLSFRGISLFCYSPFPLHTYQLNWNKKVHVSKSE